MAIEVARVLVFHEPRQRTLLTADHGVILQLELANGLLGSLEALWKILLGELLLFRLASGETSKVLLWRLLRVKLEWLLGIRLNAMLR